MKNMCNEPIYCPKCGRKVGAYDGKSKINKSMKCNKCEKMVLFDVEIKETKIKEIPKRTQASGTRFY